MPTLTWTGKEAVTAHGRRVPYHLLRERPELSAGEPGCGNLIVQGDNLLALKALLPYYGGQVKCIYIDPPYNTGNENWVYNDNVNSPLIRDWLGKTVGKDAEDLNRHDKWLCMMYPRLQLLRDFLREDGMIFVSIDDNEYRFLALVLEELFGSANRVETFIWKKSYGGGAKSKHVVNLHEYVLCFAKDIQKLGPVTLPPDTRVMKYYKYRDDQFETRGPYRLQPLATNSMDPRPNLRYPIHFQGEDIWPEKQWQWSRDRALTALAKNELVIAKRQGKWSVSYKQYLRDADGEERGRKAYSIVEGVYTQQGTNEVKAMFGDGKIFSFPKPSALIEHFLQIATDKDSLVLDSFAGSGTTGHAVLSLNKKDGGHRRFILVEMEENIARIVTAERVRRVCQGYTKTGGTSGGMPAPTAEQDTDAELTLELETGEAGQVPGLGGGFRYCELAEPLFNELGMINPKVAFAELARHVFFTETGEPLPPDAALDLPLIGIHQGRAIYLLYNGILKDRSKDGGNYLTSAVYDSLPPFTGPKVIYAVGCSISRERRAQLGFTFKQTPYDLKTR